GTVHSASTDGAAALPANSTLSNGAGDFFATLKTAGSRFLTATDTANASFNGSSFIDVQAAKATVSAVIVGFAAGIFAVRTAADGLRLLIAGRNTSLPFANVDHVRITFNQAAVLSAGDVS